MVAAATRASFTQGLPLVLITAQLVLSLSPVQRNVTHGCVPKVLKLSSNVNERKPCLQHAVHQPVVEFADHHPHAHLERRERGAM